MAETTPFLIDVPREHVDRVLSRVAAYPWDDAPAGASWQGGTSLAFLRRVCERWTGGYDWYVTQAELNTLGSQRADVEGTAIHFLRVAGEGRDVLPILLVPGWPSTVLDYADVVRPLAAAGHDVVVASMPGFGWSSPPPYPMGPRPIAQVLHRLMADVLGFERYAAAGTDFATYVSPWLALDHPESLAGIHVTALNLRPHGAPAGATSWPEGFTTEELDFLQREQRAQFPLLPYVFVQALQGQTLSLAMVDNPVGLAAWILEKHHAWTPLRDGQDPDAVFDLDRLITTVMIYALTGTFPSSLLVYAGLFGDPDQLDEGQRV
jgi:pimeloyl-ACP methyl ester carboxylesterase